MPDRPPPFQRTSPKKLSNRPDRADITPEMITATMQSPDHEALQADGRIRRWRWFAERGRWLRVVLLDDDATVHNAFWDRISAMTTEWQPVRYCAETNTMAVELRPWPGGDGDAVGYEAGPDLVIHDAPDGAPWLWEMAHRGERRRELISRS